VARRHRAQIARAPPLSPAIAQSLGIDFRQAVMATLWNTPALA